MNVVVRTHVRTPQRLALLQRTLSSMRDKGVWPVNVVDDHSPMTSEVQKLCAGFNVQCCRSAGERGHTINGLISSFQISDMTSPLLCTVDDLVLGHSTRKALDEIENLIIPKLSDRPWAMIGLFACYVNRSESLPNLKLWHIPTEILYALVCHVYSPQIMRLAATEWNDVVAGRQGDPCCCDDIFIKRICQRHNLICFNTLQDFAQHTGGGERTFGSATDLRGSYYESPLFIGE